MWIYLIFGFVFGSLWGSFVVNIGDRLAGYFFGTLSQRRNTLAKIFLRSSHCPHCQKKIPFYDLVPVFSWFFVCGRCRYCQKHIPLFYPVTELLWAVLGSALGFSFYQKLSMLQGVAIGQLLYFIAILTIVSWLALIDFKTLHIPNSLIIALLLLTMPIWIHQIILQPTSHLDIFLLRRGSGVILTLVFFLLYIFLPNKMGYADIKFIFAIGLALNIEEAIYMTMLGSLLGIGGALLYSYKTRVALQKIRTPLVTVLALGIYFYWLYEIILQNFQFLS